MNFLTLRSQFESATLERDALNSYTFGKQLLEHHSTALGRSKDETAAIVFNAAAQVGDETTVHDIYKYLCEAHPESQRLDRMGCSIASMAKTKEAVSTALKLMQCAIEKDPVALANRRVMLSIIKHCNTTSAELLKLLSAHVEEMPTDAASWKELGDLCLRTGRLVEARLCFEELALVLETGNLYYLITLADICYSLNALVPAIKYFCVAITFEPYSQRAMWGIILTFMRMWDERKDYESVLEQNRCVALLAVKRMMMMYEAEHEFLLGEPQEEEKSSGADSILRKRPCLVFIESQVALCKKVLADLEDNSP